MTAQGSTEQCASDSNIALAEKYAREREVRINLLQEKEDAYVNLREIQDAKFARDPWVDYEQVRSIECKVCDGDSKKIIILGAGHCGILVGVRLIQAGIPKDDILLIDDAGGFGGTWYWNRYPGLACDVESYIYLPLLEDTESVPTQKYEFGAAIRRNCERIAKTYGLNVLFTTRILEMKWDEANLGWILTMNRRLSDSNDISLRLNCQFLFNGCGFLTVPRIPNIPGIDDYLSGGGRIFHTARWDYDLTGGSQEDPNLTRLRGKRVAVVGTGATGVQVIPHVANFAEQLYVVQRTPSYVGTRANRDTTADIWNEVASKKGWQSARSDNFTARVCNMSPEKDLIADGWTQAEALAGFMGGRGKYETVTVENASDHVSYLFEKDARRAAELRARVDEVVHDTAVAQNLKAWYPGWCKRPVFHDAFLPTFNKPNVKLVYTEGRSLERFTKHGFVANGVEYSVDVMMMATGFETSPASSAQSRSNARILGRGGRLFDDKWNGSDFGTLHGLMMNDFPNLFFQSGVQQASSYNLTALYDALARHVAHIIKEGIQQEASRKGVFVIEPSKNDEQDWSAEVAKGALWYSTMQICTPGYMSSEVKMKVPKTAEELAIAAKRVPWAKGLIDYCKVLEDWRLSNDMGKMSSCIQPGDDSAAH